MSSRVIREQPDARPPGSAFVFRLYKSFLSPILHAVAPGGCRYLPTCSEYACVACARFGAVRGTWLSVWRVLRCHPWSRGGLDPVPESNTDRQRPAA